jgi:starvation-inducible outer membrane lipoprotein
MKLMLVLLSLLLAGCATDPRFAEHCSDDIGCGAYVVNPNFGPIQAQAVAPDSRTSRIPFN